MKAILDGVLDFGTSHTHELLLILIAVLVVLCFYQLIRIGAVVKRATSGLGHYLDVVLDTEPMTDDQAAEVELTQEEKELLLSTNDRSPVNQRSRECRKKDEELFNEVLKEYF